LEKLKDTNFLGSQVKKTISDILMFYWLKKPILMFSYMFLE